MKCEFKRCIYNRASTCILDSHGIDSLGMCDVLIAVSLDEKFLEAEKKRQLTELERRWVEDNT